MPFGRRPKEQPPPPRPNSYASFGSNSSGTYQQQQSYQQYQGNGSGPAQHGYYGQYQNGYGHSTSYRPPPRNADPQLWEWFIVVDTDNSGEISAFELQKALMNGDWTPFDVDTCKMLMGIFDTDRSGSISFPEFTGLWKYIQEWQKVFAHFDADCSGTIDRNELANALRQFGYNLNSQLLGMLQSKFETLPEEGMSRARATPGITFDRFVRACVVVKTLTEAFRRLDTDGDGWITVNYETFMATILSAP